MDDLNVRTANVYNMIMQRCYNEKMTGYKHYGGRGIYVDDEWLNNPTSFFNWYKANYFDGGQVDRINNDGPYSEANCRMVSAKENGRNRRNTRLIEAFGEKKNAAEWVDDERCHVSDWRNLLRRIDCGVPPEVAMSKDYRANRYSLAGKTQRESAPQIEAFGESKSLGDWSEDGRCLVSKKTLHYRLSNGWSTEEAITTKKNGAYHK